MNSNDEIFKKIQASIQEARDAFKLKEKISNDITEILSMISAITDNAVSFKIDDNNISHPAYISCQKIVRIIKSGNPFYGFILCGYNIDDLTGYPVSIETEKSIFNCNDDDALKNVISDLLSTKETSMQIVKLISVDDIPF
ncbi:hypothetical protein [Klebsiella quasipneumoniae]|uniref:hypothetical protein n=1 Tax=Klebsiella quasipneumoniae TaxID=1463165 RepID=UPI00248160B9|nr:hypothetical protein [Klebsiella quasipneumoniae]